MLKGRLTLSVNNELIKRLKIRAIHDDTTVTAIVEELIIEYFNREKNNKSQKES